MRWLDNGDFMGVFTSSDADEPKIPASVSEQRRNQIHSTLLSPSSGTRPHQREPPYEHQNTAGANRTRRARTRCMPWLPSAPCFLRSCATHALAIQPLYLLYWNPSPPEYWSPVFASLPNLSSTARSPPVHPSPLWSPRSSLFPNPCSANRALQSRLCSPQTWWRMHPMSQGEVVEQLCAHGRKPVPIPQFQFRRCHPERQW